MTYQIVQWVQVPVMAGYVQHVQPTMPMQTMQCVAVPQMRQVVQPQSPQSPQQMVLVQQRVAVRTPPQQPTAAPVEKAVSVSAPSSPCSPCGASPPKTPMQTPKVAFDYVDSKLTPLRVSGKTKASGLAGAIAKRLRMCQSVAVEAMGAESVATTTTALALAKTFISIANLSMLVQVESIYAPSRSHDEEADHPGLRFMVSATLCEEVVEYKHDATRKVPEGSQVAKVAGSISKMIRGNKDGAINMALEGRSSQLLNTAVKSIALSRAMLQGDDLDIVFQPHFKSPDKRYSLVDITVLAIPRKPGTTHTFLPSSVPSSEHTGSDGDSEQSVSENIIEPELEDEDAPPALLPEDVIACLNEYLETM
eukprot:TRINITY_DN537_c5_g1_i1.p1 TRINITY_DN537_c5_g1~~TRINITY_DN537_c5_g1_i1.p1  ORF type:complete len:391 (+),score=137.61 TRINITY_DN537_c5_g1_i1:80-1174(+)